MHDGEQHADDDGGGERKAATVGTGAASEDNNNGLRGKANSKAVAGQANDIAPVHSLAELRERPVWVCWKLVPDEPKPRKVPYYAASGRRRTGTQGSAEDRAQLVTYAEAQAVARRGSYEGVGFAVLPDLQLTVHDVDQALTESGALKPFVAAHLAALGTTYIEWSPSGGGLHALFAGRSIDKKLHSDKGPEGVGLELFTAKGFITFTDKPYNGAVEKFAPLTVELTARLKKAVSQEPKSKPKAFNADNPRELARLRSALEWLSNEDADDFEKWKRVALALGRAFQQRDGVGIDLALEFARRSPKFDEAQTRHMYFVSSAEPCEQPVGVGTIFETAKATGWRQDMADPALRAFPDRLALLKGDCAPEALLAALTTNAAGLVHNNIANAALLLRHALLTHGGEIYFDQFRRAVMARRGGTVAEIADSDVLDWTARFQMDPSLSKLALETFQRAADLIAFQNAIDPVIEWLDALVWDETPRLASWLARGLGVEENEYTIAAGRNFLIAAVARQYVPGCKVDNVLVMEGEQGTKKSTALRTLFGAEWFSDDLPSFDHPDFNRFLRSKVCFEIADLSATKRADVERIKATLTHQVDRYRDPYARREIEVPRRCVFAATTNDAEYLRDDTGNRRFIPVTCGAIDVDWIAANREALFAEAVAAYRAGDRWWDYPQELTRKEQERRREHHGIEEVVIEWSAGMGAKATHVRSLDICNKLLDIPVERRSPNTNHIIASALRNSGWINLGQTTVNKVPGRWFRRESWQEGDPYVAATFPF